MARPVQQKLRLRDKRRRMQWVKVAVGTSIVMVSIGVLWYVARLPNITIQEVAVSGTRFADETAVKNSAVASLGGSYFKLIPYKNSFVVSHGSIARALESEFPEIASVDVSRDGLQKLSVVVHERMPKALWCESNSENSCYYMDGDGLIFHKAESNAGYVRYEGKISGDPLRSTFLRGAFAPLHEFVESVQKTTAKEARIVSVDENADASLMFSDGSSLKFVLTEDSKDTLDNIASVFASQRLKGGTPFDYIDFRFGDKVYVKYRNE